jgi:hypothetical protein
VTKNQTIPPLVWQSLKLVSGKLSFLILALAGRPEDKIYTEGRQPMPSFRCPVCGREQPDGVEPLKKPTELRRVILDPVEDRDPETGLLIVSSRERLEIVKEEGVCPLCFKDPRVSKIVEVVDG